MNTALAALAHDIESSFDLSDELMARVRDALAANMDTPPSIEDFRSTDAVLGLVRQCLPGWTIRIRGTATTPNGHWHCSLRQSAIRDNDPYVGIGQGPTLPHALLAAVLGALAQAG
ncbi:hypothetical protein [Jannaschia aquimarina]|uniref:Uncharacterized protein n=1 Tax=Jannaschia aquimarina TaxID=935700 RepID=A0A0D1D4R6_9RHOB|nr:hypothetical protein [Jannaschia aquimarina]KIT15063.1 hypothetical protein jaqu_33890 [Jannaschia aquimarina]SNS63135.1 hypothetical protein SAMN05421775_101715 [Jannaschia aquimarina]